MKVLPYSLQEQVDAMRSDWPDFRVGFRGSGQSDVVWRGCVTPQFRSYQLKIDYNLGLLFKGPTVRINSPQLSRLPGNKEGELPHVYDVNGDPSLCLFDPSAEEWSGWMLVSQTTLPWAIDWLTCYEWWLITGTWHGGGRHPSTPHIHDLLEISR